MKKEWLKYILTAINIVFIAIFFISKETVSLSFTTNSLALVASSLLIIIAYFKMKTRVIFLAHFFLLQLVILVNHIFTITDTIAISCLISTIAFVVVNLIHEEKNKKKYTFVTFAIVLYILYQTQISELSLILSSLDIEGVRDYIAGFGVLAPIVSILLMVLQSILAPIPAFLITFSNALVFGWVKGAILSWTGAMIGASICFAIARFLGRDVAVKYAGKSQLESVDSYFEKYGKVSILVARLLPFMPFDPISYGAGLTNMSFTSFAIATGLGQLPATIIYSYFAGNITTQAKGILWGMCAMFIISATFMTIKTRKGKTNE